MAHSNQMREFVLSDDGIKLIDVYIGSGEVLTGSARLGQESKDRAKAVVEQQAAAVRQRELEQEEASLKAQAGVISARLTEIEAERKITSQTDQKRGTQIEKDRKEMATARKAD
jgi:circadian clock protein KaiC